MIIMLIMMAIMMIKINVAVGVERVGGITAIINGA